MSAPVKKLSDIGTPWLDNPRHLPERPAPAASNTFPPISLVPEQPRAAEPTGFELVMPQQAYAPEAEHAPQQPHATPAPDYDREFRRQILEWYQERARSQRHAEILERSGDSLRARLGLNRKRTLRIALLAGGSALAAFYLVGILPNLDDGGFKTVAVKVQDKPQETAMKASKLVAPITANAPKTKPVLAVQDLRGPGGEWLPLGADAQGAPEGAIIVVSGLTDGARLSEGQPLTSGGWRVDAAELKDLMLLGPMNNAPSQELTFELRLADGTPVDRKSVHVDYLSVQKPVEVKIVNVRADPAQASQNASGGAPAQPKAAPQAVASLSADVPQQSAAPAAIAPAALEAQANASPQATEQPPAAQPSASQSSAGSLDKEEIELLVKRGEGFISTGDLAAARLILQRAAAARDARAAFALASTYDPGVLEKLRVYGAASDIELAMMWYERAKVYGSKEAVGRLQALARRMP